MNADQRLKTLSGLSGLWDGSKISRTRAGDGDSTLYGRRVSLHLMIQPPVALLLLGDDLANGQGFLARCLVAAPESLIGGQKYVEKDPAETPEYRAYADSLRRLYRKELSFSDSDGWCLRPEPLRLDVEAKRQWIAFHDGVQNEMKAGGQLENVKRLGAKAAEHVLRLAGVLTTLEDPGAETVGVLMIERGAALVLWYLEEAVRLRGCSLADPDLVDAEKLLYWMQGRPDMTESMSSIYQKGPSGIRSKTRAEKLLEILENHGWAQKVEGWTDRSGTLRRVAWRVRQ